MSSIVPVFFTINDGYAPYLAVALHSLIRNADRSRHYNIHVIYQDLSPENREKLAAMETSYASVFFQQMEETLTGIEDSEETKLRCDYFTLTIYYRLFLGDMFPQYDKGIYLDSDIVVPGDVSRLYDLDLGANIVGACHDFSIEDAPPLVHYVEQAVGVPIGEYVNSGVLLLNLKKMRELHFGQEFLSRLNRFHFNCLAPDQDYLNAMCNGRILYLDKTWDTMPQKGKPEVETPQLIHYNLFDKPWCYDDIQYQNVFWHYAAETPYYNELRQQLASYGEAAKAHDRESFQSMGEKAMEIPGQEVTFQKMANKGEAIRICS